MSEFVKQNEEAVWSLDFDGYHAEVQQGVLEGVGSLVVFDGSDVVVHSEVVGTQVGGLAKGVTVLSDDWEAAARAAVV